MMQICGSKKTLDMCDMRLHFLFKKAVVNLVVNVDQKNLEIVEDMLAWQKHCKHRTGNIGQN